MLQVCVVEQLWLVGQVAVAGSMADNLHQALLHAVQAVVDSRTVAACSTGSVVDTRHTLVAAVEVVEAADVKQTMAAAQRDTTTAACEMDGCNPTLASATEVRTMTESWVADSKDDTRELSLVDRC